MSKTFGLCLGAGGSRGVAHVGFLAAMEEEGLYPDYISGCSMGAVVGAAYASGMSPQKIKEAVLSVKMGGLISLDLKMIKNNGMLKTDRMKNILMKYFGGMTFKDLKIPFRCVSTDLISGTQKVFDCGYLLDAVAASSCIPVFFQPMLSDKGEYFIDGGILDRVPASVLKDMGSDTVVAIDVLATLTPVPEIPKNLMETMLRMIGIMDIRRTEILRQVRGNGIDLWLEPELENMSQYSLKEVSFAYDKGYECGKENADKIRKILER